MEKIIWKHTLAETNLFKIEWVDIDFANGKVSQFQLVWFNHVDEDLAGWVMICAYNNQSKEILLIEQFQLAIWWRTLVFPRGWLMTGLSTQESAQKELLEETWYLAGHWVQLATIYSSPWYFNQKTTIFFCHSLTSSSETVAWDEFEDINVHKVLLKDAVEMVMNWTIIDARTISGIMMVNEYIKWIAL